MRQILRAVWRAKRISPSLPHDPGPRQAVQTALHRSRTLPPQAVGFPAELERP